MENSFKVIVQCENAISDEIIAILFNQHCTGVEQDVNNIIAYFSSKETSEQHIHSFFEELSAKYNLSYSISTVNHTNWNKVWESNYSPITIDEFCYIYAPFHDKNSNCQHQILIQPKMAFGTGHHATTELMIRSIQTINVKNKSVLDLGCGTGILAILAHKEEAKSVTAVDIDPISIQHLPENFSTNSALDITYFQGTILDIQQHFDVILANINRNVLVEDSKEICKRLNQNGVLALSGFYKEDVNFILEAFEQFGLKSYQVSEKNNWACILFKKIGKVIE